MKTSEATLTSIKELLREESEVMRDQVLKLRFSSDNGRHFGIDGHERDGFFAFELLSTGVLFAGGKNGSRIWSKHVDAMSDLNGYQEALVADSIDPKAMMYMGGGSSPRDIIWPTLAEAIAAIDSAIQDNTAFNSRSNA